ncbi:MAG: cohesin domain-containing protein [Candidatus Aminicenantales bacterium]
MKKIKPQKLLFAYIFFFALFIVLGTQAGVKKEGIKAEVEKQKSKSALRSTLLAAATSICGNIEVVPTPSNGTYNEEIDVYINITNNQCEMCSFAFDLFYETSMFSYQGIETQNCLTSDWTMVDANEITPGQVRAGGFAGSASCIQKTESGSLVIVKLKVTCQCGLCQNGQQSTITINSYSDELKSYTPQPAQAIFTLRCCSGNISLPSDKAGTMGDVAYIPVNISDNDNQICDFTFDFVFDPSVFEFKGLERSTAIQDWSSLDWNQIESGKIRITGAASSGTCIPAKSNLSLVTMKLMVKCVDYPADTSIPMKIEEYKDGIAALCPRSFEVDFLYKACPRLGDVNEDGSLTPGDAQMAFEIYLGKISPSSSQLTTSDANCSCPCTSKEHSEANNCITPGDAQNIFDHYLGRMTLPLCCADYQCSQTSILGRRESSIPGLEKRLVYALPTIGNSEGRVKIPVMVNNPRGIRSFRLEMIYPYELLEYGGLKASPLTKGFDYVRGEEEVSGIIEIEGKGKEPILKPGVGSLAVVVFNVKKGPSGRGPLLLYNLDGDIFRAKTAPSWFVRKAYLNGEEKSLTLGESRKMGGILVVPVEVTNAFGVKAFGLEMKYSAEKMTFIEAKPAFLTKDFITVDGNEIERGVIRVGGYSMNGIQERVGGKLVELMFQVKESGGKVEIIKAVDDLADFVVTN